MPSAFSSKCLLHTELLGLIERGILPLNEIAFSDKQLSLFAFKKMVVLLLNKRAFWLCFYITNGCFFLLLNKKKLLLLDEIFVFHQSNGPFCV